MQHYQYKTMPKVHLECNGEWVDFQKVKFDDIAEDIYGRDVVTFECPECGEFHKSLVTR